MLSKTCRWIGAWGMLVMMASNSLAGEPRKWVSNDGKFSVVGEMLGFTEDDLVVIRKDKQTEPIRVPLSRLSSADQDFVAEFKRKALGQTPVPGGTITQGADGKWILDSTIKVDLPPGASEWMLTSKEPLTFVAKRKDDASRDLLTIVYRPFVESRSARRDIANDAEQEGYDLLQQLGAKPTKDPKSWGSPPALVSTKKFEGELPDGTHVECQSILRFDLEGFTMFRAVGTPAEVAAALKVAEAFAYVNPVATSQPAPTVGPPAAIPQDRKQSFEKFLANTKELLRSGEAKEVLEAIVSPEDLKQIKAANQFEDVAKGFDKAKRDELLAVLESFDWTKAKYDAKAKSLTFQATTSSRPMTIVETSEGWRIKN